MANDPERPIERALRAQAERRREQAGPAFELHPANRRLLQQEIARYFRKPEATTQSLLATWLRLWPSLGWSVATLVGLGIAALLMLPSMTQERQPAPMLAKNKREQETAKEAPALLARNDEKKNVEPASSPTAMDEVDRERAAANSPTRLRDEVARSTAAGVAPPPASAPAETRSTSANALVLEPQATLAERSRPQVETEAISGAAAPVFRAMTPGLVNQTPAGLAKDERMPSQRFVQVPSASSATAAFADSALNANAVLASFEVEQAGRRLLVVDGDGSVYKGSLQIDPNLPVDQSVRQRNAVEANDFKTAKLKPQINLRSAAPAQPAFFFRVEGTNITSKERVVFTGNLFAGTNDPGSPLTKSNAPGISDNLNGASNAPGLQLRNVRIQGEASVGNRQPVIVNAVPAGR